MNEEAKRLLQEAKELLGEIVQKLGRFSRDPYEHAQNVIDDNAERATQAIAKLDAALSIEGWVGVEEYGIPAGRHLAVVDGDVRTVQFGKTSHVPLCGWCLADQGVEDFDLCKPTFLRPLPPAPKAVDAGSLTGQGGTGEGG